MSYEDEAERGEAERIAIVEEAAAELDSYRREALEEWEAEQAELAARSPRVARANWVGYIASLDAQSG